MRGWLRRREDRVPAETEDDRRLAHQEEPNPLVAFAVGLIYVFRTAAGARIMRELEGAVRKYSADPHALWRLVHKGEHGDVIDTTVATERKRLDEQKE